MCEVTLRSIEVICNISTAQDINKNHIYRLILCWMNEDLVQAHFMNRTWTKYDKKHNTGMCKGKL